MSQVIVYSGNLKYTPFRFVGTSVRVSSTVVTVAPIGLEDIYDLLVDIIIPKLEALQACCYTNTKNTLALKNESESIRRDIKLLTASNERMKKGRL